MIWYVDRQNQRFVTAFTFEGAVSAAAAAADGHAGGDANGWNPNNMECQPLNSTIACSPVACSPVACSKVACAALACSTG